MVVKRSINVWCGVRRTSPLVATRGKLSNPKTQTGLKTPKDPNATTRVQSWEW